MFSKEETAKMIVDGKTKADFLVAQAKRERDKRGYRENLGYDAIHKLEDYLETLHLSYSGKAEVIRYFYSQCDTI